MATRTQANLKSEYGFSWATILMQLVLVAGLVSFAACVHPSSTYNPDNLNFAKLDEFLEGYEDRNDRELEFKLMKGEFSTKPFWSDSRRAFKLIEKIVKLRNYPEESRCGKSALNALYALSVEMFRVRTDNRLNKLVHHFANQMAGFCYEYVTRMLFARYLNKVSIDRRNRLNTIIDSNFVQEHESGRAGRQSLEMPFLHQLIFQSLSRGVVANEMQSSGLEPTLENYCQRRHVDSVQGATELVDKYLVQPCEKYVPAMEEYFAHLEAILRYMQTPSRVGLNVNYSNADSLNYVRETNLKKQLVVFAVCSIADNDDQLTHLRNYIARVARN